MKYLREALLKTRAKWLTLLSVFTGVAYCILNAAIVVWITDAISGDMVAAGKVVIGCILTTVLNALGRLDISTAIIFNYMSNKLAEKVTHADYDMFVRFSPDSILVTHSNIKHVARVVNHIKRMVIESITIVVNIVAILTINKPAILPILPIFIIMGLCMYIGFKKWRIMDEKFDTVRRRSDKALYDVINGFSEVRSFSNTEEVHLNKIISNRDLATKIMFKRAIIDLMLRLNYEGGNGIVTVILMILSMTSVANGNIAVATAINTVMYGWRITQPMSIFIDATSDFAESVALVKPYEELMDFVNTVPEGDIDIHALKYCISFRNVSFSYDNDSNDVLNNISFSIHKGEHIGICGTSGGGKSTLLKLIPKFYDRDRGCIMIDGIDIRDISKSSLRSVIGIVHQDPYIFDGTIMDNLKYANKDADYYTIVSACEKAALYDFIMSLKDGFNTHVGPKGMKLSGGQKQRIALARIFLSDPDIIILDEATSALDTVTERFIQNMMDTLFKDKTMIVVAHRLSTIINSDRIFVLDKGTIAEEGSHEDLVRRKTPIYNRLIGEDDKIMD